MRNRRPCPGARGAACSGAVRLPADAEIYAPEFPSRLSWLGVPFLRMGTLMGRGAVLVEFWDFARVHSLRTLPYLWPGTSATPKRGCAWWACTARDTRSGATPSW